MDKRKFSPKSEQAAELYREKFFLPVLFHNGKNYDAHFVLKHFERKWIKKRGTNGETCFDDVRVIPTNDEKFLMFQMGNVRFLDLFQFLSTSLNDLVSLLLKSGKTLSNTPGNILAQTMTSYLPRVCSPTVI